MYRSGAKIVRAVSEHTGGQVFRREIRSIDVYRVEEKKITG